MAMEGKAWSKGRF